MWEQITKEIFKIQVPLPNSPLRELNSYLIRGPERELLIDTGFQNDVCREVLETALAEIGSDIERRDVILTHVHSDHSGLAEELAGRERKIFISAPDLWCVKAFKNGTLRPMQIDHYCEDGFPREQVEKLFSSGAEWIAISKRVDARFSPLKDGDEILVGDHMLKMILTPGHSPGNAMFWLEKEKIMFTGDHVLFDITPNIAAWGIMKDSLGEYLASLKKVRDYPVKLALPAHRESGDYRTRIDQLLIHHEARANETLQIVCDLPGLSAYEIASHMSWKIRAKSWEDFPLTQKWFAVGECLSHLDHLVLRGVLRRSQEDGFRRYEIFR